MGSLGERSVFLRRSLPSPVILSSMALPPLRRQKYEIFSSRLKFLNPLAFIRHH